MPLQTIGMLTPTADVSITPLGGTLQSYRGYLDSFSIDEVVELVPEDTFANEGSVKTTPGRDQLRVTASGVLKLGAAGAGPLIPFPQGALIAFLYATGCSISSNWNASRSGATRVVNANGRLSLDAVSQGTYVVLWDRGT